MLELLFFPATFSPLNTCVVTSFCQDAILEAQRAVEEAEREEREAREAAEGHQGRGAGQVGGEAIKK